MSRYAELFRGNSLLGSLGERELDGLLARARTMSCKAGKIILQKDDAGDCLLMVLSGSVKIVSKSNEGREIILSLMKRGEIFGELALLDGGDRSADAVAETDCELLVIQRRDFERFLRDHVDVAISLLAIVARRLRQTSDQVADLAFLGLSGRLAKRILSMAREAARTSSRNAPVRIEINQRTMGGFAGATRESVNRQLAKWADRGLIEMSDGGIIIRDLAKLDDLEF
jgi:CRP/FNR family transcriptional regulator, cyclic AMP receptor protein